VSGEDLGIGAVESDILVLRALNVGEYVFQFTVIDDELEEGHDEIHVKVEYAELDDLGISKAFTPNGDGRNDVWFIKEIDQISDCRVYVFNRAGVEVFSAYPYRNNWDGTFGGAPLPDGDYYYIIKCNDERGPKRGALRIIKE